MKNNINILLLGLFLLGFLALGLLRLLGGLLLALDRCGV